MATQTLPTKENALFKQVVKLYEDKQYKKAIKTADQILKKYPDHGETLAMKGLTLSNMGPDKKEEAYELVRKGLKCNLKSHVCWHVYGLLYRQDKDHKEAIKCYMNALRLDNDNLQILRDLATLQIQMRDLPGFVDTRQKLLQVKPSNRSHWITLAVAHHANKSYETAVKVLEAYENSLSEVPASEAYEFSELLLYKALVLDEGGKLEDALNLLDKQKDKLKDKLGMLEHRASLLLRLGRTKEAEEQYRALVASNPDHYRYHEQLQACLGLRASADKPLTQDQRQQLKSLYEELSREYPRSSACKRIPLDFLQGADFEAAADSYVRKYLTKGVPSLFMDLRPLYGDPDKVASLERIFSSYHKSLETTGAYPPLLGAQGQNGHASQPAKESPQTLVWVLYYLAQHYDRLGQAAQAHELLGVALGHTPTLIELHTLQSKLRRHAGDLEGAAESAETARRFDLSDRYLNSMAVKALLRADQVNAAEKTAALFLKDDNPGGLMTLTDMQHMWFEVAAGAAHMRRKDYGRALKRYRAVISHFDDIHEDQFDFHGYCIRKTTLRAYIDTLRMEDQLFGHPYFLKAAAGAIRTYLAITDAPSAAQKAADEEALLAAMTPEERKKHKLKKKKEEKNKAREAEEAAAKEKQQQQQQTSSDSKDKKKGGQAHVERKDDDPDGSKLASVEDPLGEAAKLVVQLKTHNPKALDTHILAAEVYARRKRHLLALAGVQTAVKLAGAQHPDVHRVLVKAALAAQAALNDGSTPLNPTVKQLITSTLQSLLGKHKDLASYNTAWVTAHGKQSLPHRVAAAESLVLVGGPSAKSEAVDVICSIPAGTVPGTHPECVRAAELLSGPLISDNQGADKWRALCATAYPMSRYFGGKDVATLQDYGFSSLTEAFGRLSFA